MDERPNILVVDDVAVNVTLISCMFKKLPYNLYTAYSGDEALKVMDSNDINLVLLDIMMPEMAGYEVLQRIRNQESTKNVPVVMLSALNLHKDVEKAYELGANDFISKPVVMPKLIATVKKFV